MTISFARHQFPPAIIRHAVWLYLRFTLSYRDVEDLLAERGLFALRFARGRCNPARNALPQEATRRRSHRVAAQH
jgi:transposase-like protein